MSLIARYANGGLSLRDHVKITDCHAHVGPCGLFHCPANSPDEVIKIMDRIGVARACVSHSIAIGPDFKLGNGLVHEAMTRYPDRFIGYAVLNPNYPEEIQEELDICFKRYKMRGIKFHGDLHRYPLDGEDYKPVLEYAESNSLTLLCHGLGKVRTLRELSSQYRNINFLIAHYGSWDMRAIPEAIAVAREAPNVYLDSSGSVEWFGGFERVVAEVGTEKVLFGSDFPWGNLAFMMGRVLLADIPDESKRRMLGENAEILFGIR